MEVESSTVETFDYKFMVKAPLDKVRAFHQDTTSLKKLNPPPIIVQLQRVDPMVEDSVSEFTLWIGPLPIHWRAVHSQVSKYGFTDIQERGPMARWQHTHHFLPVSDRVTQIQEHIEYEHFPGWRGILTRLLFNPLGLKTLFTYRKWATRQALRSQTRNT